MALTTIKLHQKEIQRDKGYMIDNDIDCYVMESQAYIFHPGFVLHFWRLFEKQCNLHSHKYHLPALPNLTKPPLEQQNQHPLSLLISERVSVRTIAGGGCLIRPCVNRGINQKHN